MAYRPLEIAIAAFALSASVSMSTAAENVAPPKGYSIVDEDKTYSISLNGETVFSIGFDIGMMPFEIDGPRDMTGNGVPDLTVLWMTSRSTSDFAVFEFWPEGFATLFQTSGMTRDMLNTYSGLSDAQVAALVSGGVSSPDLRPQAKITLPQHLTKEPEDGSAKPQTAEGPAALPETNGFWRYKPGNLDEGTSAELGWMEPDLSEKTFSLIKFLCRANGDDTWVLPMYFVDEERENPEEPDRLRFTLDGTPFDINIWWQLNDETGHYEPMGSLPPDTDFFDRLVKADEVVMQCGDISPDILDGAAGDANQVAELKQFIRQCKQSSAR